MLGLYSLVFCLGLIIRIIATNNTLQKKVLHIILVAPVICYLLITLKLVKPILSFLQSNAQSIIGA